MANFDDAVKFVLEHEGGYVHNQNDPGGATNFGISSRFLNVARLDPDFRRILDLNRNDYIDPEEIAKMNEEQAKKIYEDFFWNKYNYEKIICQKIANKIFDLAVNIGPNRAHKIAQEATNKVRFEKNLKQIKDSEYLKIDGILGKKTIKMINECNSYNLLLKIKELAQEYYKDIVKKNLKLKIFLKGWLRRANH
jgi:lysozyme family protein